MDANPAEAMRKAGIDVPEGKQVKLVQNTSNTTYLVLPELADGVELSEEELGSIYAGMCDGTSCMVCYPGNCGP